MSHHVVNVALGDRAYAITIGSKTRFMLAETVRRLNAKQKHIAIITDENVASYHLNGIESHLEDHGYVVETLILPAGEGTKSFAFLEKTCRFLIEKKVERKHAVVALGGGVIGDLVGLCASLVRRGCHFIQMPTTLLSQVDSSVGGKTAINVPEGKNLVGAFYQPKAVLIDTDFLDTLPIREFWAGYAEVIKYALLGDSDFFTWLDTHLADIAAKDKIILSDMIRHCCKMKADIVVEDEHETGKRALLNLGHTFGHVFEAETGYSDKLLHGEAVAIGLCLAADFSAKRRLCAAEEAEKIKLHLSETSLPLTYKRVLPDLSFACFLHHVKQDKKVEDGLLTFILLEKIGQAIIDKTVTEEELKEFFA